MKTSKSDLIYLQGLARRIQEMCEIADVGAHIVLHRPGYAEVASNFSPSYSRLAVTRQEEGIEVRIRSKLEDYGGNKEAQAQDLAATANMLHMFLEILGNGAMMMATVHDELAKQIGPEHGAMYRPNDGTTP